jgi:integrase
MLSACTETPVRRERRKSLERRILQQPYAQPVARQTGYVYQKGRKKTDPWLPYVRSYGRYRISIPGQAQDHEVRVALGFCRDRVAAMLKLRTTMSEAGVLDVEKIRQRITPAITFRQQATWWISEMRAGRIVSAKKRISIDPKTIGGYETAIAYLNLQVGDAPLASLDNPEAKALISKMKAELRIERRRFSDKTIVEYFKVFTRVIASAVDEKLKQVYPRDWDLTAICLPMVNLREQRRPTFTAKEVTDIVARATGQYQVLYALWAGTGMRLSEALALEIDKHLGPDCSIIKVRQQRDRWGKVKTHLKTDAAFRDIDLHPSLAKMLRDFIGDRKRGLLFQTQNGTMLNPSNIFRDSFEPILEEASVDQGRFHAFRRFRESVLQRSDVRMVLINFWIGHADREMSSRYAKQLLDDVEYRQEWATRIGLGFKLPPERPELIGLRGLQKVESTVAA